MSRIGRLPIAVPGGVDVAIDGQTVNVKGPKGSLSHTVVTAAHRDGLRDGEAQLPIGALDRHGLAVDGHIDARGHSDGKSSDSRHLAPPYQT